MSKPFREHHGHSLIKEMRQVGVKNQTEFEVSEGVQPEVNLRLAYNSRAEAIARANMVEARAEAAIADEKENRQAPKQPPGYPRTC